MCKIKEYSDKMQSHLESVLLRIDTYLLQEDLSKQLFILRDLFGGTPSEIPFDEITQQTIDIDSVADLHDAYLNNILDSNIIYCLKNASVEGINQDIYLNKFFVAFYVQSNKYHIENIILSIKDTYFQKQDIPTIYSYLRLNYHLENIPNKELWDICDKSAFPIMEEVDYNGKYTDTIERDKIFIDLSRSISPCNSDAGRYDVNIQTKTIFAAPILNEVKGRILDAARQSKNEITRCFKS